MRPAAAQPEGGDRTVVEVIEVSGLIDPIQVEFIADSLVEAEAAGAEALVIRLDSRGGVVPTTVLDLLTFRLRKAEVPVAVWVGPGRASRALGQAYAIFRAADVQGLASGARVGDAPAPVLGGPNVLADRVVGAEEAVELGVADLLAPTLGDFIVSLGDVEGAGITIPTEVVDQGAGIRQRQPAESVQVRFDEPSLIAQLLHAVATPSAAYVLGIVGLLLVVFELYTAGVGVAAGVAALCLLLSGYGLGVLPVRWWSLALVVVGVAGYAVDVQAGAPRAWTAIGTVALVIGGLTLYDGGLDVPLVVQALVVAMVALFMVSGMPAVIRTRFSTATIGRESMVGEQGLALSDVAPDGTVRVRDATWPARTNRATPIRAGELLRVAAIDGLVLEVEPLEGAARDAGH